MPKKPSSALISSQSGNQLSYFVLSDVINLAVTLKCHLYKHITFWITSKLGKVKFSLGKCIFLFDNLDFIVEQDCDYRVDTHFKCDRLFIKTLLEVSNSFKSQQKRIVFDPQRLQKQIKNSDAINPVIILSNFSAQ